VILSETISTALQDRECCSWQGISMATLGSYNKQFGKKRSELQKHVQKFQRKQSKLIKQLGQEHWGNTEVLLIIASPTGKVQTVMSPGLERDDTMVKGGDAIDEMMQHHVQKGVKLSILAKMVPEVVEWGEEEEGEARTVSAFGKLQTAVVRFIKGPLQAKAAAAQEEALKGKMLPLMRFAIVRRCLIAVSFCSIQYQS